MTNWSIKSPVLPLGASPKVLVGNGLHTVATVVLGVAFYNRVPAIHADAGFGIFVCAALVVATTLKALELPSKNGSSLIYIYDLPIVALVALGHPILVFVAYIPALVFNLLRGQRPLSNVYFNTLGMLSYVFLASIILNALDVPQKIIVERQIDFVVVFGALIAGLTYMIFHLFFYGLLDRLAFGSKLIPAAYGDIKTDATTSVVLLLLVPILAYSVVAAPLLLPGFIAAIGSVAYNGYTALSREHEAKHDALTQLPNRTSFATRAERSVDEAIKSGKTGAIVVLDLDGFKAINDEHGHAVGDKLLVEVAARLQQNLRGDDMVARLGGDEFAFILDDATVERVTEVLSNVFVALAKPIQLTEGVVTSIGASSGIALFPEDGNKVSDLVEKADFAMYSAKTERTGMQFYSPREDRRRQGKGAVIEKLRADIEAGKLELEFQPQVDLVSNEIVGVEALVRWLRDGRMVAPVEFIELAEKSGVISHITRFVLDRTLDAAHRAEAEGFRITWSVNISARDLNDPEFLEYLTTSLLKHGVRADRLELELTELTFLQPSERMLERLHQIHDLGVKLSVDDFGTGYGTLTYLRGQPFSTIKIDKSFVEHFCENQQDATIVESTIELAHKLGMKVVAEGIETAEALHRLRLLRCDTGQGFFIQRPIPLGVLMGWLAQREDDRGVFTFDAAEDKN